MGNPKKPWDSWIFRESWHLCCNITDTCLRILQLQMYDRLINSNTIQLINDKVIHQSKDD